MVRSRFGYRTVIPTTTAKKDQTKPFSYVGGVDTYSDNDDMPPTKLRFAHDARMVKKGRYRTRKGANRYSVPVGEAVSASQTATTGASVQIVNGTRALAEKLTVSSTGGITRSDIRIRTTSTSAGSLLVEYYTNVGGLPGELLATSSILPASVGSSFAYLPSYFMSAPQVTSGDIIWQVIRGQDENVGDYEISTTTASSNAAVREGATTWMAAAYSLNARVYVSPANAVKGVYRAYRFNGLKVTLMVAGTTLYSVDDVTGATIVLQTGLSASATRYRFDMAQDTVYMTNEYEKPYKIVLSTMAVSVVSTALANARTPIEHKGLMFYINADDPSQTYYSNFGAYDTFTSTDFLTWGSPKSPHSLVALAKLNGALYGFAKRNKLVLLGDSNATFSIDEATDQRGTFTQESLTWDENFIYHADEDGIHQFNGTDSRNLAEPFLEDYKAIPDKSTIVLDVRDNRLYCFYMPSGQSQNTECFVVNTLLNIYEAKDLETYIGRSFARLTQDDIFIQASNRVAALYYGEADGNNYDNLGAQLQFELGTAFDHFDTPGQYKRIPKWRPVFDSVAGTWGVDVGYAFENRPDPQWLETVSLASNNPRLNTGLLLNTGVRVATPGGLVEPQNLYIPGEFKRAQRRYRHIAAHEPVEVDSELLTVETERLH